MNILNYAKTKTISGFGTTKFENPVTVLRLVLSLAFFAVQLGVYSWLFSGLGASGVINLVLSVIAAGWVTYKLFTFLKIARHEDSTATPSQH